MKLAYNLIGTIFVLGSALLGIIAIIVLIVAAGTAPKESTSDIEKFQ